MILVLSSEYDFSTSEVLQWLKKLSAPYIRLNNCNQHKIVINSDGSSYFKIAEGKIKLDEITAVWFRRKDTTALLTQGKNNELFTNTVNTNLSNEESASYFALLSNLKKVFWINSPKDTLINKYEVLTIAKSVGLKIPESLITNDYFEIKTFINKNRKVICKNTRDLRMIEQDGVCYTSLVNIVDVKQFNRISSSTKLLPSLFQKYIDKKMEIRTVFLNNRFYSMAMFTQDIKQTAIDFRRIYTKEIPTRRIPFSLPRQIETKLRLLFKKIEMNSGSIDLIVDNNNDIFFLEINPIGQFGMTSFPCNYQLEKEFAIALIENSRSGKRK